MRRGQQPRRDRVFPHGLPVVVDPAEGPESSSAKVTNGALHRIERVPSAREDAGLDELPELLAKRPVLQRNLVEAGSRRELAHRHAVLGERARLVDTEHGRRAQAFDRGEATGQDVLARDPPGAERQEDGQDDGKFFGQDRHGQRETCQKTVEPVPPHQPVHNDQGQAEGNRTDGDPAHEAAGLPLETRLLGNDRLEGLPDPADLGARSGCVRAGDGASGDQESSRIDERLVVSPRPAPRRRAGPHP